MPDSRRQVGGKQAEKSVRKFFDMLLQLYMGRTIPDELTPAFLIEQGGDDSQDDADPNAEKIDRFDADQAVHFGTEALRCLSLVGCCDRLGTMSKSLVNKGKTKDGGMVSLLLNRLFCVEMELQEHIYDLFKRCLDSVRQEALKNGDDEGGILDMDGGFRIEDSIEMFQDENTGAKAKFFSVVHDRGVSWDAAKKQAEDAKEEGRVVVFLRQKARPFGWRKEDNKRFYSLAIATRPGTSRPSFFRMTKPTQGRGSIDVSRSEIKEKHDFMDGSDSASMSEVEAGCKATSTFFLTTRVQSTPLHTRRATYSS